MENDNSIHNLIINYSALYNNNYISVIIKMYKFVFLGWFEKKFYANV